MSAVPPNRFRMLPERAEALLQLEDYLGVGNLMLEVLMRPGQERDADSEARQLVYLAPGIIARRFGIPEGLTYPCPYRDKQIAHTDRGNWAKDEFVMLIILAYVLGATRENLPPPHDALVRYYAQTADEQRRILEQVAKQYQERRRAAPPKPMVAQDRIQAILQNEHEDAETKLQAITALLTARAEAAEVRARSSDGIA